METRSRRKQAVFLRIHGAYMICTEMYGNGCRMFMVRIQDRRRPIPQDLTILLILNCSGTHILTHI